MDVSLGEQTDDLTALCRRFGVAQLHLFGSAATSGFDPSRSDLDFLVRFKPCSPVEHYERYFGLLEALEDLYGRAVDLVEEPAMRNPYFIREVNRTRTLLYAA